ncbi:hypothetical protein CR203_14910 [Salipaludibacillus neizhouensis]|uniref:Cell wall hydrolase SleB domain-containing protein n=1 Tax=Salipaludibacillus neizhouensis TaxID=885475 RepID=A0A3A9KG00_9BACI|nr:cell wall hydrolase [Salipaludibacillus neizhouensis]RKL66575.1 hypothetical protein CR203_14910 [Salipaludibacillus neizhouensis]
MKKLIGLLLAGILAFTAATSTMASFNYQDENSSQAIEGDTINYIKKRHSVELDNLDKFNPFIVSGSLHTDTPSNQIWESVSIDRVETQRATLSTDDRHLLEHLVHAEARGQVYEGKVAVAEVVLNRVDSNEFPDNVYEVITQKRQFEPYATGTIKNSPDADTIAAVQEALEGTNLVDGALYFWNSTTATSRWLEKMTVVTTIDDHEFLE